MSREPNDVPSFAAPPVVEVVAGVAFDAMGPEATSLALSFWREQLRDRYPVLQQQPPYPAQIERFGDGPTEPDLRILMGQPFPDGRFWAISPDSRELVQLQASWFACNWRKVLPDDEYDRWEKRRHSFGHLYADYLAFLDKHEAFGPKVTQAEVSYINHVRPTQSWSNHSDFSKVFRLPFASVPSGLSLEQVGLQFRLGFSEPEGVRGRLHVTIAPAFDRDGATPLYSMELTARGAPLSGDTESVLHFMDAGRRAINQTFLDLTTEEVQGDWGRVQ